MIIHYFQTDLYGNLLPYTMTNAKINEAVPKNADDYILTPEECYGLNFEKLVVFQGKNKYARARFDIGHKQFMEIIEKYGLKPAKKWQVYDTESKSNKPWTEG